MNKTGMSKFTKISIVCGVLGLFTSLFYGGLLGVVGLVYGCFAMQEKSKKKNVAVAGIVTSVLAILITAFMVHTSVTIMKSGQYDSMLEQMYQSEDPVEEWMEQLEKMTHVECVTMLQRKNT